MRASAQTSRPVPQAFTAGVLDRSLGEYVYDVVEEAHRQRDPWGVDYDAIVCGLRKKLEPLGIDVTDTIVKTGITEAKQHGWVWDLPRVKEKRMLYYPGEEPPES